jgi:hypothetical protein
VSGTSIVRTWFQNSEIVARGGVVVEDQEVAHPVVLHVDKAVEFLPVARIDGAAEREQLDQVGDRHLREVDRGRFERFEEAAGEADRDDILAPRVLAAPGAEAQQARVGEPFALDVGNQRGAGLILGNERAREHVAVADAVLQRDAPLPPAGRAVARV